MNLIGDIQGNYRTLLALLKQMPDDDPVSVGDMIDRGPRSMEVLEFFRNHGKALLGNHEHMMLDYFCDRGNYMPGLWLMNSGDATLNSLGLERSGSLPEILQDFLESLPLLLIRDGLLVTHAPVHKRWSLEDIASEDHLELSPLDQSNEYIFHFSLDLFYMLATILFVDQIQHRFPTLSLSRFGSL